MNITKETVQSMCDSIMKYFGSKMNVKCVSIVSDTTFTVEYYTGIHLETNKYFLMLDATLDMLFLYNVKKVSFVNKDTFINTELIGECVNYFNVNTSNLQYEISPCKAEHVFKEVTTEI